MESEAFGVMVGADGRSSSGSAFGSVVIWIPVPNGSMSACGPESSLPEGPAGDVFPPVLSPAGLPPAEFSVMATAVDVC